MQSKHKIRFGNLSELKLLIAADAPAAIKKADAPKKNTHKNKGNHGGSPGDAQAPPAPQAGAQKSRPSSRGDRLHARANRVTPAISPIAETHTEIDGKDAALFRRAMANVERMRPSQRAQLPPALTDAPEVLRQRREHASGKDTAPLAMLSDDFSPAISSQDNGDFLRPSHGPDVLKNLKLGKWPIQASLDLHGATVEEARERLDRFLQSCITHRLRCVMVVHGKGYGSQDGEPVLKAAVRRWLIQLGDVIAYAETPAPRGGSGALQILLKIEKTE